MDQLCIRHIFLGLLDLPEIHHTAENIANCIRERLKLFGIDNEQVVSLCTDSARNMPNTAELLEYEWDPCFIHIFNNCIKDFVEYHETIGLILAKANISRKKEVFVSFLESQNAPLSSNKKYSKTRWMSCYDTLCSISKLKNYIVDFAKITGEELFIEEHLDIVDSVNHFLKV